MKLLEYTQDDVSGLRELMRHPQWQKLNEWLIDMSEHQRKKIIAIAQDARIGSEEARIRTARIAGYMECIELFLSKPERMLKMIVDNPADKPVKGE